MTGSILYFLLSTLRLFDGGISEALLSGEFIAVSLMLKAFAAGMFSCSSSS